MTNSHEEAERAAFASLSKDQQERIERFRALYAEERAVVSHAAEVVAFLRKIGQTVCDHGPGNYCPRLAARELLLKMGVGAEVAS